MRRIAVAALLTLAARGAFGQYTLGDVQLSPAAPTDHDQIVVTYTAVGACGSYTPSTVVSGTVIRTTVAVAGCFIGPPGVTTLQRHTIGPFPANTYTYELYFTYQSAPASFETSRPLIVTAQVPTFSPFWTITLLFALTTAALVPLHRSG